jgi:phosphatidate cytidylyltransferase
MNSISAIAQSFNLFELISHNITHNFVPLAFYTGLAAVVYSLLGAFIWLKPLEVAKKPYLTWAILLPVIFIPLWLGSVAWAIAITLVSIYGFKEFARSTGLYEYRAYCIVVDILILGLGLCAAFNQYGLFMALPIWGIAGITTLPIQNDL